MTDQQMQDADARTRMKANTERYNKHRDSGIRLEADKERYSTEVNAALADSEQALGTSNVADLRSSAVEIRVTNHRHVTDFEAILAEVDAGMAALGQV